MFQLDYGDALWFVVLFSLVYPTLTYATTREPAPQDFDRIRPGDVGYIRGGRFNLLFSAGRPLGGKRLGVDVPVTFRQLDVGKFLNAEPRSPGCISAGGVRETRTRVGASMYPCVFSIASAFSGTSSSCSSMLEPRSSISFHLTGNQGAALLTKHLTFSEDVEKYGAFEQYTKAHYDSWVKFARACGYGDVKPVLVTGVDLTRDFAMMSYSNDGENLSAEFKMSASGVSFPWGTWSKPGAVYANRGPGPRRPPPGSQIVDQEPPIAQTTDQEPPIVQTADPEPSVTQTIDLEPSAGGHAEINSDLYRQCIFVRYYTVRTRLGIPKVMKAGAGPHDLGPGNWDDQGSPLETQCSSDSGSDTVPSPFDNGDDDGSSITSIDSQESDIVIHNTTVVGSSSFLSIFARPIDPL